MATNKRHVKSTFVGDQRVARTQAFVFYLLRSSFKSVFDDGFADWKAIMVMSIASAFAAMLLLAGISISLQRRLLPGRIPFVILFAAISIGVFNYYNSMSKSKWSRFEGDFQRTSTAVRVGGVLAVWLILIVILACAWWTVSIALKLPPFSI